MNILQWDYDLFIRINSWPADTWWAYLLILARLKWIWYPFYIFVIFYLIKQYRPLYKALTLIISMILLVVTADTLSSRIVKTTIARERPCNDLQIAHITNMHTTCKQSFSFPSSHAVNHTALALVIGLLWSSRRRNFKWSILSIWVLLICLGQIYVGVHFPLDIIGGILLGLLVGRAWYGFMIKPLLLRTHEVT